MNNLLTYSIETAICLTLFYSVYWIFLKKDTFFKINRFYLVFTLLVSLLLPLVNINIVKDDNASSFWTNHVVAPIQSYENGIDARINPNSLAHRNQILDREGESITDNTLAPQRIEKLQKDFANASQKSELSKINWLSIIVITYFIGVALFFIRFLANFIWILSHIIKHKHHSLMGLKIIKIEKNTSPFSFFNYVFLSQKDYPEAELSKIITHEKVHSIQKHSIDLILFELVLVFQWFNPIVWLYKKAIKITHEYLADIGTLNTGVDPQAYQFSLINQALLTSNIEMASSYNYSIKNRITMMTKKRSSKLSILKLTIALPILLILFSAFAFNVQSVKKKESLFEKSVPTNYDTTIKKVEVSVEYLKLIEGEYVSTNEPGRIRRIILTELFGELLANDNGYTYRPAFVGNGKFINPDDKAELIFDTKDKDKISLLLFGKINLNKVTSKGGVANVPNKSLAYATAKVIIEKGISKGLDFFKSAKDSTNYYFVEDEMNYSGYQFFERKKVKEAAAIFKLNTEKFPSSFNAHDSYAEALLALNDKAAAIEQFKKSIVLNPGSKNGIKRLKELGVDPSTVVKLPKVTMEELQLLEGVYLSTNQPNFIRKITFKISDGELTGEDNGYKYKLVALGDGKFINPDDGASLVFDTKNKNAINLLLFGKINLNKIELTKQPILNLKDYAGLYLPAKKDSILKPMEILNSTTKLFRFIDNPNDYTANRNVELEFVSGNLFFYPDNSARSIEFVVNEKKEVTGCILRRPDGTFNLTKKK